MKITITKDGINGYEIVYSGVEKYYNEDKESGGCGQQDYVIDWDAETYSYSSQSCGSSVQTINNTKYIIASKFLDGEIYFTSEGDAAKNKFGQYGCSELISNLNIVNVDYTSGSYSNQSFYSKLLHESQADITSLVPVVRGYIPSGTDIDLYFSADGKTNWQEFISGVTTVVDDPGKLLYFRADFDVGEGGYMNIVPHIDSIQFTLEDTSPSNITIDLGADGVINYYINGSLNETNGTILVNLSDVSYSYNFSETQPFIGDSYNIPIEIGSESSGIVTVSGLELLYDPSPITLTVSPFQSYLDNYGNLTTNIPLVIQSSGNQSYLNISNFNVTYAGGNQTYELNVRDEGNTTLIRGFLTYIYSRWDYQWGNDDVNFIFFNPLLPTQKNVRPYGQTLTSPILTIDNLGYNGPADLYVKMDSTLDCVNMTIWRNGSKAQITDEWLHLDELEYLDEYDVFLYTDYSCTYQTWKLFDPSIYFRQCAVDSYCGEDID
jgi:hypothetical protein